MESSPTLKELDAEIDAAFIFYRETTKTFRPNFNVLIFPPNEETLIIESIKGLICHQSLLGFVKVCANRAETDEYLGVQPTSPYAWASIARAGIERVQRRESISPSGSFERIFGDQPDERAYQCWLFEQATIYSGTQESCTRRLSRTALDK